MSHNFEFFWEGPFSNWHLSTFTVDDITYNCGEQFMMYQKALVFGDTKIAEQILKTHSPKLQKVFGRKVSNFDPVVWDSVCVEIVYQGLLAKFLQNPDLKQILLNTGDKIIAEASPYDKIWGIGLSEYDSLALNQATWQGKNYLGIVLMKVREEIRRIENDEINQSTN